VLEIPLQHSPQSFFPHAEFEFPIEAQKSRIKWSNAKWWAARESEFFWLVLNLTISKP
jgi:hypothetical protein